MVAMVLSLILIGGVIQLFVQSKTSYTLQDGIARAQENGRLGVSFIERHLRRAGYPQDTLPILNGFSRSKLAASAANFTGNSTEPVNGATDSILIQFESPPGGIVDCTGRNVTAGNFVAMQFLISGGGLSCESIVAADATPQSVQLVEGVTDMQVTYVLDTDKDGVPDTDFLDAGVAALNEDNEWQQVVAVIVDLSVPVLPAHLSNNRILRFSTTVQIRNQVGREL
jgi:type IV pilus assembly protein PilW